MRHTTLILITLLAFPFFASAQTSCPNLTRNLALGSRGADVTQLQNFLISQGDLAAGNNTRYFGQLTEAAVKKFQCRNDIICEGSPSTTGWGSVGPRTRSVIQSVCSYANAYAQATYYSQSAYYSQATYYSQSAYVPAQSCTTPLGTVVQSGSWILTYEAASVPAGGVCRSELRVCTNGALSGSFIYNTCYVQNPPAYSQATYYSQGSYSGGANAGSCTYKGQTYTEGQSVSVPNASNPQSTLTFTCDNGSWLWTNVSTNSPSYKLHYGSDVCQGAGAQVLIADFACSVSSTSGFFAMIPRHGSAPFTATLTVAASEIGSQLLGAVTIDWGDGSTGGVGPHPPVDLPHIESYSHTYTSAGSYTVTVQVATLTGTRTATGRVRVY